MQTPFGVSQSGFGGFPSGFQTSQQTTQPQCPISQVQCEQLLNFLEAHNASGSGFSTPNGFNAQTVSQVASMMAPALPFSTATSTSSSSSNFSGNPFWIPPNFNHSIFSAQVIDRQVLSLILGSLTLGPLIT